MAFQITVKISGKKEIDRTAMAKQLANIIESFTGKRTIVNVRRPSGVPAKK